jgi:hypothetical protein
LALQAVLLKDDLLDPVDELLDDPALLELVQHNVWRDDSPLRRAPGGPA